MTAVARTVAGLLAAAIAFLYLGRTVTPDSSIYLLVNDHVLRWLSTLIEVPTLVAGVVFSFGAARALGRENPAARGFRLLGMWMAFFAVGQLAYSFYPLVLRRPTPLPWWGDALYLAGYSAMIAGIVSFQRTYASSGFAVGTTPQRSVLGVAIAVSAAEVLLLAPIFELETPWVERALNLAFPLFDGVAIVALFGLAATMRTLRGGRLWQIWMRLLVALALACVGDVLFAYFFFHHLARLEALVNLAFMASYALAAIAARDQLRLLRSRD